MARAVVRSDFLLAVVTANQLRPHLEVDVPVVLLEEVPLPERVGAELARVQLSRVVLRHLVILIKARVDLTFRFA